MRKRIDWKRVGEWILFFFYVITPIGFLDVMERLRIMREMDNLKFHRPEDKK